ncbi:MAG TPA: hypothetical protein VN817_02025 [Solirubrobacteraceae bacterium]|nr:hypothetical protein [Solirubrobacteraceae bacterium]
MSSRGGTFTSSPERLAMLQWAVRMGAITAESLAHREGATPASSRAKLSRARGEGLILAQRPLTDLPTLYTATAAGVRASGIRGLDPCRVSATGAQHLVACAHVAAALERGYPEHSVSGERELRRRERASGTPIASAVLSRTSDRGRQLHRPDLVIWPAASAYGLPLAVEVELTIKAPRRLAEICRAWARSRHVDGVLYIAPAEVRRALERAIATAQAGERIAVVPLETMPLSI